MDFMMKIRDGGYSHVLEVVRVSYGVQ